jgi:hypothetical protein
VVRQAPEVRTCDPGGLKGHLAKGEILGETYLAQLLPLPN